MTIGEIREKIEGLADDMEVVAIGYFGEAVHLSDYGFRVRSGPNRLVESGWDFGGEMVGDVFTIPVANVGPVPD